jgi:hypothetical protein
MAAVTELATVVGTLAVCLAPFALEFFSSSSQQRFVNLAGFTASVGCSHSATPRQGSGPTRTDSAFVAGSDSGSGVDA